MPIIMAPSSTQDQTNSAHARVRLLFLTIKLNLIFIKSRANYQCTANSDRHYDRGLVKERGVRGNDPCRRSLMRHPTSGRWIFSVGECNPMRLINLVPPPKP